MENRLDLVGECNPPEDYEQRAGSKSPPRGKKTSARSWRCDRGRATKWKAA